MSDQRHERGRGHIGARTDAGATGIEYALIGCFIALALLVGTALIGNGLNMTFYVTGNRVMNAASIAEQSPN